MVLLAATIFALALNIWGGPSHVTRRPSATSFWALDVSGGAGSISSPVLAEHPKNVSELAVGLENWFRNRAAVAPPWLLISALAVVTREIAQRQLEENVVPSLVQSDAQPKAYDLLNKARARLDNRISVDVLKPAGYGDAERIINRLVQPEIDDATKLVETLATDYNDVVTNEVTRAVLDVVRRRSAVLARVFRRL